MIRTFTLAALLLTPLTAALEVVKPNESNDLTVINCADKPVYATAITIPDAVLYGGLKLPEGTPLKATTTLGQSVTLVLGVENGIKGPRLSFA